ncbi:MAG: lytic transglycosylase domain-containing protein [Deltaproteobacteria bacterium]|nr:lytic transglycosylase domain-containing protein [Deltaproteobacteria bacterium]
MRSTLRRAVVCAGLVAIAQFARAQAEPADPRAAGPALREALALLASDPARGREALAGVEQRFPIVADHAAHQAIASFAREASHAAVGERAGAFAASYASSPLLGRVAQLDGEAALALGSFTRAANAFAVARKHGSDAEARAALALAEARARQAGGEDVAGALLAIWRDRAATKAAAAAHAELTKLAGGPQRITAADHAARCCNLFRAFWNAEALAACDAALASDALGARARADLAALRAELLFRDRQYPAAERAFAALPDSRENRFWRARALARSGRIPAAKRAFEALGETGDSWGARALFLAGTLYEDDDAATARTRYEQALARAKTAELRIEARWRLAWRATLEKRWSDAASGLAALARDTADPIEALRARYWEARALHAVGDARGDTRLATLARDWRFTYYGQEAAARANGAQPERAGEAPSLGPEPRGEPLPAAALLRTRILLEAGLREEAGAEARALAPRARLREDRLALASLLQDAGEFGAAQRVVLDAYGLELAAGPPSGEADLWWAAYPRAFPADVERAAAAAGIPPELLFAVMREESGFDPKALSVVGARGLVQIMPDTGRKLAARLGSASFDPDELFVPARNLELAAAYLAELLARFGGNASAAIASYNAGPEAVERWRSQLGHLEQDAWIEAIAYDQTRSYVKRVLRSYRIYQALY